MLIRQAEIRGRRFDVRVRAGQIAEIEDGLSAEPGETELDARGGALLPGLHDHHLHLLSTAASLESIDCRPSHTPDRRAFIEAIQGAAPSPSGLRGAGYFESIAGPLDRDVLDLLCPDKPLRIQHRNGSMWFLNSAAIDRLGIDTRPTPEGVERDATGRATGRLFRVDDWLREQRPASAPPGLARIGARLLECGVTGVTDATPTNGRDVFEIIRHAQSSGAFPQRVHLMGGAELAEIQGSSELAVGPCKILLDEPALPPLDALIESIRDAHSSGRPVAIHTVTRAEIHFALAGFESAGSRKGDRLEHASVAPPEAIEAARRLGLIIVTQPNFVAERGDAYLSDVDPKDRPHLYLLGSWLRAGVALAGGTDAPFGEPDVWCALRSATDRRVPSGETLGLGEALTPEEALSLFLGELDDPGGPAREVAVGRPADLCLLDSPWREIREGLDSAHVAATIRDGEIAWIRPDLS